MNTENLKKSQCKKTFWYKKSSFTVTTKLDRNINIFISVGNVRSNLTQFMCQIKRSTHEDSRNCCCCDFRETPIGGLWSLLESFQTDLNYICKYKEVETWKIWFMQVEDILAIYVIIWLQHNWGYSNICVFSYKLILQ